MALAGSTKLRLVRCPKCKNIPPEQPGYSVYQCGACGAVLRGKHIHGAAGSSPLSEKRDHQVNYGVESTDDDDGYASEIGASNPSDASSDSDIKHSDESLRYAKRLSGWSGTRIIDSREDVNMVLKGRRLRHNAERIRSSEDNAQVGSQINFSPTDPGGHLKTLKNESRGAAEKWVAENELNFKSGRNGLEFEHVEPRSPVASTSHALRFENMTDWKNGERGGTKKELPRNLHPNDSRFGARFSTSKYPDEGSSSSMYQISSSSHRHEMQFRDRLRERGGADAIRHLDNDRSALLRKIEELSRAYEAVGINKRGIPFSRRTVRPADYYATPTSASKPADRATYQGPYVADSFPYGNRPDFVQQHSYPSAHRVPRFGDSDGSDMQYYHSPHDRYHRSSYAEPSSLDPRDRRQMLHHPREPFFDVPRDRYFYDHESRGPRPPLYAPSRQPQMSHARPSDDVRSPSSDGFARKLPPEVVVPTSLKQLDRPIVGAAPFLTCHNCFELLHFPKELLLHEKQQKIRCGSCSATIGCTVSNKRLVLSFLAETKEADVFYGDSPDKLLREEHARQRGSDSRENNNYSDNYDDAGYAFHSLDGQPVPPSADNTSKDGQFDGGSHSSGREKVVKSIPQVQKQESTDEEECRATEIDVSIHEYSNARASQDSLDMMSAAEDEVRKISEEAGLANRMSKSLRGFSSGSIQSDEDDDGVTTDVSINGHALPDKSVRRAEKLAGPICPGDYWYDFRAGFWGAMGGPCLGIIPPFIEEFKYRMAEHCAGGNTGILVNGRELHQRDLEMLCVKGLPRGRDRSYIIEISGKVTDEETGEEVVSLGKLAPTVEKMKCGFGMEVLRIAEEEEEEEEEED